MSRSGRIRAAGSLADQVVSSATNFVVTLVALRELDISSLGAFMLVYTFATLGLTVLRSMTLEPLMMAYSAAKPEAVRVAGSEAAGTSLALALVLGGAVLAPLGVVLQSGQLLGVALALPAIVVQDAWRFTYFTGGRMWAATINDSICLVTTVVGAVALIKLEHTGAGWLMGLWGAGSLAGAIAGVLNLRTVPRIDRTGIWLHAHGRTGVHLAGGTTAQQAAGRLSQLLISLIAGNYALGLISASRTLVTPLTTVVNAAAAFAVPEAVRRRNTPLEVVRISRLVSATLGAIVVLFCGLLLVTPASIGERVIGPNWNDSTLLLIPTGAWVLGIALNQGPRVALRAFNASADILRISLVMGALLLVGTAIGALTFGAAGAAWGFGLVSMGGQVLWLRSQARAAKATRPLPARGEA